MILYGGIKMRQNRKKRQLRALICLLACAFALSCASCGDAQSAQGAEQQASSEQTEEAGESEETGESISAGAEDAEETASAAYSRQPQQIAEDFVQTWNSKWIEIEENGVTSTMTGCAFLADLDGDGLGELIFLYDNDIHYDAVVYRISGQSAEELGSFTLSNTSPELHFTVFSGGQGQHGDILRHIAVRELTAQNGSETEESYITVDQDKVLQEILFSTTYDGVDTYYDSIMAGANEIPLEEFDAMRQDLLQGAQESGSITFTAADFIDFSDTDALTSYIEGVLTK